MRFVAVAVLAVGMAGCTAVGPDYVKPELSATPSFVGGPNNALHNAATEKWWMHFQDPILNSLVQNGFAQNLDIATALTRIDAARANANRFGISQQVDGDASIGYEIGEADNASFDRGAAQVGAGFVFDIFGATSRARESAGAALSAAQLDSGTVRLAYLAELVSAYIDLRFAQDAQRITRQTIRSREEALGITRRRRDIGDSTQIELARASALAASARASLPVAQSVERENAFRIATLLNQPASEILAQTSQRRSIPKPKVQRTVGVPADLLRNRPDIRATERRLAALTAEIGVREAALYPSLRVDGNVTISSSDSWSFGPALVLPLTNRPALFANRKIAEANAKEAELAYRAAFISAIEELQVALSQTDARRRQVVELTSANGDSQSAMNLTMDSFEQGIVDLETVLDAERTRLDNSLDLALGQAEYAQAWVRQQVAVGKGWASSNPQEPTDEGS